MFHASTAPITRLVRRLRSRLALDSEYAAWHGWQVQQIRPGTYRYRDPRFDQLAARRAARQDAAAGRRS